MTQVAFGLFDCIDRGTTPLHQLYEERLQLLEAADFFCYHLAEHHATPLGMAPSPSLFLSAIAHPAHSPGAAGLSPSPLQPPAAHRRSLHAGPPLKLRRLSDFPHRSSRSPRSGSPPKPPAPAAVTPHYALLRATAAGDREGAEAVASAATCLVEFLLCCRCCQALVNAFSPSTLSAVSHGPNWSGGFRWRWDPSVANDLLSVRAHTPVTRFSLRLATRAGRPVGGDPIYPTASVKGPDVQRAASTRTKIER
jgi:hypothetical protein